MESMLKNMGVSTSDLVKYVSGTSTSTSGILNNLSVATVELVVKRVIPLNTEELRVLRDLKSSSGESFPGSDFRPPDRKNWMAHLDQEKATINRIVWPGTHNSATDQLSVAVARPFAQCQTLSIYGQLAMGARVLDVRVQQDRLVCNDIVCGYNVSAVFKDVKRFLSETQSEIVILEVRTEFGQRDPAGFEAHLEDELGEYLVPQDEAVFEKRISEILPKRIICIWKPRGAPPSSGSGLLWAPGFLRDDWVETQLGSAKFESNMKRLSEQQKVSSRNFFYRVENTLSTSVRNPLVEELHKQIKGYARLFISQCVAKGCVDRFQIFSTDFLDQDFVDACVGLTRARLQGRV